MRPAITRTQAIARLGFRRCCSFSVGPTRGRSASCDGFFFLAMVDRPQSYWNEIGIPRVNRKDVRVHRQLSQPCATRERCERAAELELRLERVEGHHDLQDR